MVKSLAIKAAVVVGVLVVLHLFAPAAVKTYTGTT
jgi:hypothetical protein